MTREMRDDLTPQGYIRQMLRERMQVICDL